MLEARMVAVSTQGFALAAQIESARAARMAPWAHGLAAAFATNSSSEYDPEKWEPVFGKRSCSRSNAAFTLLWNEHEVHWLLCPRACSSRDPEVPGSSVFGGLEKLHEVARRIAQQNLRASRPPHDLISKLHASSTQPRDLGRQILHDQVNAVPAAGSGFGSIGHRSASRTGRPCQQQPQ